MSVIPVASKSVFTVATIVHVSSAAIKYSQQDNNVIIRSIVCVGLGVVAMPR